MAKTESEVKNHELFNMVNSLRERLLEAGTPQSPRLEQLVLELACEQLQLIQRSRNDGLMRGFLSQYSAENAIEGAIYEANRKKKPILFAAGDLDHFKRINDTNGHLIGDQVLIETGQFIVSRIRRSDMGMRLGGEEIGIIVRLDSLRSGKVIFERIRRGLPGYLAKKIPQLDGQRQTISLGVTQIRNGDSIITLRQRADMLLYKAKVYRNLVCYG